MPACAHRQQDAEQRRARLRFGAMTAPQDQATVPPQMDWPRFPPAPKSGGPVGLLRFLLRNQLLRPRYAACFLRYLRHKVVLRDRLVTDGPCFIGPGSRVTL